MNESVSQSSSPSKRRSWVQFGTRTLFVLIVLAAVAAWFARGEMAKEQRREELIAEQTQIGNELIPNTNEKIPWNRRLAAWLRGKPPTAHVYSAHLPKEVSISALRELMEVFPQARFDVHFLNGQSSPELLEMIASIKLLDSVHFRGDVDTSDESIVWLGKLRPAQPMYLRVDHVDDDLLRRMADANVNVGAVWEKGQAEGSGWQAITNEGLLKAAQLPNLANLGAGRMADDQGLAPFKNHAAVEIVELVGSGYTDAGSDTLASLPKLSSLSLVDTQLTDAGIAKAIAGRRLERLNLENVSLGEKSTDAIRQLTALRRLELRNVPITPELAAAFAKHPIERLRLDGDYSDADLSALAPIAPTLTNISLGTPNVTDQGLVWLGRTTKLTHLSLNDTQATAATLRGIKTTAPGLCLSAGGPNIDAAFLREATAAFKLDVISLRGPSIDDEVLAAIAPPYISLSLAGTRTTAAGLRALKTADQKNRVVICYPKGSEPPFTPTEVEEIRTSVDLELFPLNPAIYDRMLPSSSRRTTSEASSP